MGLSKNGIVVAMEILLTGAAGFIGFHLFSELEKQGHCVHGIDSLNEYYDKSLKTSRLTELGFTRQNDNFLNSRYQNASFSRIDMSDAESLFRLFEKKHFDAVIHLAAQPGVRYSISNPEAYVSNNLVAFSNLLECCRKSKTKQLIFASSSSVYGDNGKVPFSEDDRTDNPLSFYAATKKSDEILAYSYSQLYGLNITGLRFFTVYGPWGRPDMALFKFTKSILNGEIIDVYGNGKLSRDFTYVKDIVRGVTLVNAALEPGYHIYNIGHGSPVNLMDFICEIERALGKKAKLRMLPPQAGDVFRTWADISRFQKQFQYRPETNLSEGVKAFVEWYLGFYK